MYICMLECRGCIFTILTDTRVSLQLDFRLRHCYVYLCFSIFVSISCNPARKASVPLQQFAYIHSLNLRERSHADNPVRFIFALSGARAASLWSIVNTLKAAAGCHNASVRPERLVTMNRPQAEVTEEHKRDFALTRIHRRPSTITH